MSKVLNMSGGGAQEAPVITVSSSGLITAKAGDETTTKQLSTQAAKTITPTTYAQTAVASGKYTTGAVTVAGDSNLVPENIRKGWSIFGVDGAMEQGVTLCTTSVQSVSVYSGTKIRCYCPGITASSALIGFNAYIGIEFDYDGGSQFIFSGVVCSHTRIAINEYGGYICADSVPFELADNYVLLDLSDMIDRSYNTGTSITAVEPLEPSGAAVFENSAEYY